MSRGYLEKVILIAPISFTASDEMCQTIGEAVFAGMLGVTFFGLLFTPVFYMAMTAFSKEAKKEAES